MRGEVRRKGFWHEPDARPTSKAIALQAWAPVAVEMLCEREGRRIPAADLVAGVQDRSLVRTSHPVATWMPELLLLVDHLRAREGEGPLSGLVGAPPPPRSPAPRRTSSGGPGPRSSRPTSPRQPARSDRPVSTCPRCFMALPATGVCDTCD